jgi:hypothetical protein
LRSTLYSPLSDCGLLSTLHFQIAVHSLLSTLTTSLCLPDSLVYGERPRPSNPPSPPQFAKRILARSRHFLIPLLFPGFPEWTSEFRCSILGAFPVIGGQAQEALVKRAPGV